MEPAPQAMTYLQPILTAAVLLAFAAAGFARRGRVTAAARTAWLAGALLFLSSWPPAAAFFAWTLEAGLPSAAPADSGAQAIVVLAANLYAPNPPRPFRILGQGSHLRCQCALWLYRNGRQLPILASGGLDGEVVVAEEMARVLRTEGVPPEHVLTESRSLNTYENARFSAQMLAAMGIRRIILVTEAYHMKRAGLAFRRQGMEVWQAPCGFRSWEFQWRWTQFFPAAKALLGTEDALHEWMGLAYYRLRGWI
jgi:uncharacterized SAM-binding protein YcdF (DUF218 family)